MIECYIKRVYNSAYMYVTMCVIMILGTDIWNLNKYLANQQYKLS